MNESEHNNLNNKIIYNSNQNVIRSNYNSNRPIIKANVNSVQETKKAIKQLPNHIQISITDQK